MDFKKQSLQHAQDPVFYRAVSLLYSLLIEDDLTISELHSAVTFAALKLEHEKAISTVEGRLPSDFTMKTINNNSQNPLTLKGAQKQ